MLLYLNNQLITETAVNTESALNSDSHFKQLFIEYFEGLYTYAYTILKSNLHAKDITQQAYLKLWEKRNSINLFQSGQAYLYTTVYRLSLNKLRDLDNQKRNTQNIYLAISSDSNPAESKELREKIQAAIDALPDRCKEVFIKNRLEGKKYREIAAEMNISVKTVEVQMGKALKQLRSSLSGINESWLVIFLLLDTLFKSL
jgi:RNA polymerase sigma-70 factor, ECF subfamily